jgi:hypothetical protein
MMSPILHVVSVLLFYAFMRKMEIDYLGNILESLQINTSYR